VSSMTLHAYIEQALYSPTGYYMQRSPVGGRGGDFITAPEMTQVFGEVLALWVMDQWMKMGSPSDFHLVELGPGRGTLIADVIRTARVLPAFLEALSIYLMEISPALQEIQAEKVQGAPVSWVNSLAEIPAGPAVIIANEFFDALPIDQYIYEDGWQQRCVVEEGGQWRWSSQRADLPYPGVPGQIREVCPLMESIVQEIAGQRRSHCSILIIDYGYDDPLANGDTLQAMRNHARHDPLLAPGTADITHHVNFGELSALFSDAGWEVNGPIGQGAFLTKMGFLERTEQLALKASPEQAGLLRTAAARLTMPNQMGQLFRVLAATSGPVLAPAGF
jgi:NADH dehydrogenase [ubiquinone] 1 alpha subcomplex assembly factor 7